MFFDRPEAGRRAVVVQIQIGAAAIQGALQEACELTTSAGLTVAGVLTGQRREPHPRWFLGQGKVDELRAALVEHDADLVIVNHDLGANQLRNLETDVGCRVITRTELILLIFADRARTHEGKLQVELAQLRHAQTRVTRGWTHLDRQKGGVSLRGAGETQQEMDRRILTRRVKKLEMRLEEVRKRRSLNRRRRQRQRVATVALVGYTNAGKSTLFNALTDAAVLSEHRLFATLDPTLRVWPLPGAGDVVLADTVGFIRDLPVSLVDAFRATLEEVAQADLLLLVVDISDDSAELQVAEVRRTLADIGAERVPVLVVYNKVDCLDGDCDAALLLDLPEDADASELERGLSGSTDQDYAVDDGRDGGYRGRACRVSAVTGDGIDELVVTAGRMLSAGHAELDVLLPPDAGKTRSWLYGLGAVVTEEIRENGAMALRVKGEPALAARIERVPGAVVTAAAGQ